jgi:hypothetical protein
MSDIPAVVRQLVRDDLKQALADDLAYRLERKPGATLFALGGCGEDEDRVDADLAVIADFLGDAQEALARRDIRTVREKALELIPTPVGRDSREGFPDAGLM